jgi:hypothetical protein
MKKTSNSVSKPMSMLTKVARLLVAALVAIAGGSAVGMADEVTDWNQTMLQATLTAPVTPAPVTTRVAAIVQAAIFDAINGIDHHYAEVYVSPNGPPGASTRAAAVQAAYAALVYLYPDQKPTFDQQRTGSLAAITDSADAVQQGLAWGQSVADQIWAWRKQDGFSNTPAPYQGGTQPGQWRPTPPAMAPGLVPQLATTAPWIIREPSQFRTSGPPSMTSDQYTADFNEVKTMGGSTSSARTANQTLYAKFWQAGNPPDYWDPVVISLAVQHGYSTLQTARLLALVDLGMADAAIGCWDAKYTYSLWRPVSSIQLADTDGNDSTMSDSTWTPLITTPPFPEYPSAHSCVSGAATRILSATFGEETSFSVASDAMPGVTRTFQNFSAALEEVRNARVFGGIHFRTATIDGTALGVAVGDYILGHGLIREHGDK